MNHITLLHPFQIEIERIMELCTVRLISNIPPLYSNPHAPRFFPCTTSTSSLILNNPRFTSGLRHCVNSPSTTSTEVSTATTPSFFADDNKEDSTPSFFAEEKKEDSTPSFFEDEKKEDSSGTVENTTLDVKKEDSVPQKYSAPQEESSGDPDLSKFFEDLGIKIDFEENKNSIIALGVGGFIALWIASGVVGAIDRIPLLPKVLELVGLGYTVWFTIRYLIFEESRGEMVAKVDKIKQDIFG